MRTLNKLYWLKKDIEKIEEQIRELTVLKASAIASMGASGVSSPVERFVEKLDKLQARLADKLNQYVEEQDRVENFIESIDDEEVRVIARMRWIDNCGYAEIADSLYIDQSTARKKLKRYIDEIEKAGE